MKTDKIQTQRGGATKAFVREAKKGDKRPGDKAES